MTWFKFTNNKMNIDGHTLYQIMYTTDVKIEGKDGEIFEEKKGHHGGWIDKNAIIDKNTPSIIDEYSFVCGVGSRLPGRSVVVESTIIDSVILNDTKKENNIVFFINSDIKNVIIELKNGIIHIEDSVIKNETLNTENLEIEVNATNVKYPIIIEKSIISLENGIALIGVNNSTFILKNTNICFNNKEARKIQISLESYVRIIESEFYGNIFFAIKESDVKIEKTKFKCGVAIETSDGAICVFNSDFSGKKDEKRVSFDVKISGEICVQNVVSIGGVRFGALDGKINVNKCKINGTPKILSNEIIMTAIVRSDIFDNTIIKDSVIKDSKISGDSKISNARLAKSNISGDAIIGFDINGFQSKAIKDSTLELNINKKDDFLIHDKLTKSKTGIVLYRNEKGDVVLAEDIGIFAKKKESAHMVLKRVESIFEQKIKTNSNKIKERQLAELVTRIEEEIEQTILFVEPEYKNYTELYCIAFWLDIINFTLNEETDCDTESINDIYVNSWKIDINNKKALEKSLPIIIPRMLLKNIDIKFRKKSRESIKII